MTNNTRSSLAIQKVVDAIPYAQEQHLACVLLIDASGSMSGQKISEVNDALQSFKKYVLEDEIARKRCDIALVTFCGENEVEIIHEFSTIEKFNPPTLEAQGKTPLGYAILIAAKMIEERKKYYKQQGISYLRPWIFLITDGDPTDMQEGDQMWNDVINNTHDAEKNKKYILYNVGTQSADFRILAKIAQPKTPPVMLKEAKWHEMFQWLSRSMSATSKSTGDEQIKLESIGNWASVSTSK
jgi:uncharacterized protein YegL